MENTCKEENPESSSRDIFEIPGEPAVVINGLPPITLTDGSLILCETVGEIDSHRNICFGEWLEGREVQKLFGEQIYRGKVAQFDEESGWYRVVYEDGDFEDLEWHELQEVLLPLDITVPLKTLASKVTKKRQKQLKKSGKSATRSNNQVVKQKKTE